MEGSVSGGRSQQAAFSLTVNNPTTNIFRNSRTPWPHDDALKAGVELARKMSGRDLVDTDDIWSKGAMHRLCELSEWASDESAVRLEIAFFPEAVEGDMDAYLRISVYLPGHMPEDQWEPALITDEARARASRNLHFLAPVCGRKIVGDETVLWAEFPLDLVD